MLEKLKDRNNQVILIFIIIFLILFIRLSNLTIVEGEMRREKSENIRKKNIPIIAPRGEVRDRNGELLAGNIPSFTVQLVRTELPTKELNEVAIKVIDLLERNNENHIEFPIFIEAGKFSYSYDREIKVWLESLGDEYANLNDAEAVFNKIVSKNIPIENLEKEKAQEYLIAMGITPPISVSKMKFIPQIEKENFLKSYGIDIETDAQEAFEKIRKKYKVSEEYSYDDARKIITVQHALKKQGYHKYKPLQIATDISAATAILIEEEGMELPGIGVAIEPKRNYPNGDMAAHVLGTLGKISHDSEIKKYVKENGYLKSDIIGKSGIEKEYELVLRGENGSKSVEVNAYGRTVKELEYINKPKPGNDIYLTIDANLQKVAEESLKYALEEIQISGAFKSKWGDYNYKDDESLPHAKAGAVVAVDVNTGEILALANYPAYDPNLFASGISTKDWQSLQPVNKRDPIAPSPLLNISAITAVQPGSTFKMISGLTAIEYGLDPNRKFVDGKYIKIGDKSFGSWMYNAYGVSHGSNIDLYKAIEESVNYYFYNLSMDYDYYKKKPLNLGLSIHSILDYAKKFGLGEKTGIETYEVSYGTPDPEKKAKGIKASLRRRLDGIAKDYFNEEILSNEQILNETIAQIVEWADDNPSRPETIRRLRNIGIEESRVDSLADIIVFDYFKQMVFKEGDAFNLSIGQGSHAYTPLQMARYISAVANGGYLNGFRLTKKVGDDLIIGENKEKIELNDDNNLNHIKQGMLEVTQGSKGTARKVFRDFPALVAAKTGTAERYGKIPPEDEMEYLKTNLKSIAYGISTEDINVMYFNILRQRKEELAELQDELERLELELDSLKNDNGTTKENNDEVENRKAEVKNQRDKVKKKIITRLTKGYFDEGNIMREAIKKVSEGRITDKEIDKYKEDYDNFAWFVSFAPYDKPEIAVVVLLFQGGHGGYGAPIAREIIAEYLKLELPESNEIEDENP